ncbi:MAG: peptidoglycan editing factor PgeF [Saprospiraceae bacterium]|nr:peptidoglycan editing factor PgeF [Saprospiraceae bacterium]
MSKEIVTKSMAVFPRFAACFPDIVAAQSTRYGGVSKGSYGTLNLGTNTEDAEEDTERNKELFCDFLNIEPDGLAKSRQVHGTEILYCTSPGKFEGYDALVTDHPNIWLAVSTADCVPVLLYNSDKKVCAAIHAGWKGTVAGITGKVLNFMTLNFGCKHAYTYAYIGACIAYCSFEVGDEVAVQFDVSQKRQGKVPGKYFVDLKETNKAQLLNSGVEAAHIEVSPYDTYAEENLFYSHRRDKGVTGRMWSVIGIKDRFDQ